MLEESASAAAVYNRWRVALPYDIAMQCVIKILSSTKFCKEYFTKLDLSSAEVYFVILEAGFNQRAGFIDYVDAWQPISARSLIRPGFSKTGALTL